MKNLISNLFDTIEPPFENEVFDDLLISENLRVERILSAGHTSPDGSWYDQGENEWVLVLQGAGVIEYEDGEKVRLDKGQFVNIPAHTKHRVEWTESKQTTIWLAIFYS